MNKELIERIAPEVAGEPAGEMVGHHSVGIGEMPTFRWREGYWPNVGTKLYTHPPKCARCEELEALESVSLNVRQMKRIAELEGRANGSLVEMPTAELKKLQAKLAAAEKVIGECECLLQDAVRIPGSPIKDAQDVIAEYKKVEKA